MRVNSISWRIVGWALGILGLLLLIGVVVAKLIALLVPLVLVVLLLVGAVSLARRQGNDSGSKRPEADKSSPRKRG